MARSAYREAVGYFEQALSTLPHLPETRDTREQAIDCRLALGSALLPFGDYGRILAALREAESLAVTLDDPRRLAQVSVFLSNYFYRTGVYDQAIAVAQRALALTTTSGEVVLHAQAKLRLGQAYRAQGDYRQAIACLGQTVTALAGVPRHERFGQVFIPTVLSLAFLAWCHAELGMFVEGRALGDEGLGIAEAVDHRASLIYASWGGGLLALRQGDLPRALPRLERAMDLCQDTDLPVFFPRMAAPLGAAYLLSGRVADAVQLLTPAVEQTMATATAGFHAPCALSLGEAQLMAGRLEEAHALAERTLTLVHEHQERGHEAYALHLLGAIAAHRNPLHAETAEQYYWQAHALADELGMRPLQAHCHRGLGTLYAKTCQAEQAQTALSTAIAMYRAMDMTFWLPETEAALAQVKEG